MKVLLGLAMFVAGACSSSEPVKPSLAVSEQATEVADPSLACAPIQELSALDHRRPVPLQPRMAWHQKQNMMDHLVVIQEITTALPERDWDAISASSSRFASSPGMARTCEHMGAGADGFTQLALDFHERADKIRDAARSQDADQVLRAMAQTLEACTTCHATFRQEIVPATGN